MRRGSPERVSRAGKAAARPVFWLHLSSVDDPVHVIAMNRFFRRSEHLGGYRPGFTFPPARGSVGTGK
jgi:hypothetical protein